MITLATFNDDEDSYDTKLTIDGVVIANSSIRYMPAKMGGLSIVLRDKEASEKIAQESYNSFKGIIADINLAISPVLPEIFRTVLVTYVGRTQEKIEGIAFNVNPVLSKWSKPWSFLQYATALKSELESRKDSGYRMTSRDENFALRNSSFESIRLEDFDRDAPITEVIQQASAFIKDLNGAVERELTANLNKNSLVTFFDFPPTVRVACEQYLQYFIQFLDDLGIEADSELSSDAGRVLFSVTPRSGEEALETIQNALSAYLELPKDTPMSGGEIIGGDIALIQLRANISHLQGQLTIAHGMAQLGQAMIQAKDATINAQATEIAMYQSYQMVRGTQSDLIQIEQVPSKPKPDSEPLFGNSVKVVPLRIKGIEVDLPNLLRSLKRKFPGHRR